MSDHNANRLSYTRIPLLSFILYHWTVNTLVTAFLITGIQMHQPDQGTVNFEYTPARRQVINAGVSIISHHWANLTLLAKCYRLQPDTIQVGGTCYEGSSGRVLPDHDEPEVRGQGVQEGVTKGGTKRSPLHPQRDVYRLFMRSKLPSAE